MLRKRLQLLLCAFFVLNIALPAAALETVKPMTYDSLTVTDGIKEIFPGIAVLDTTLGNSLGFTDAPKMAKYRFALPKRAGETLTLYCYETAADMRVCKGYIDGYALVHNGETVYAATTLPYTWYADGVSTIYLYCGTDKTINKKLTSFVGNPPVGGYFAGDKWEEGQALFPVLSEGANAAVIKETAVYSGGSTAYEKLGRLQKGTRVRVLSQSDNAQWVNVESDRAWACIPASAVRMDDGCSLAFLIPSSDGGDVFTGKMTAAVNVRSGPGTSYNKLGTIKKGAVVAVDEVKGDWVRLRYFMTMGPAWVNAKYVRALDE